ncbi:diguanylate cyclase (GGDEF)-like protein [Burkholderia ambifaria]|nr:diguanylate cyclase [Burkholderia ambifaria]MDR6503837.1 diguanylate cyclase (GGDEF)-like protein [Burkholderia ambifaria]
MLFAKKFVEAADPQVHPKGIERATIAIFAVFVALCLLVVFIVDQALNSAEQFTNRSADARATAIARSYANYLSERTAAADILARTVAFQYRNYKGKVDLTRLVAAGLLAPTDQTLVTLVDADGKVVQAWPTSPESIVHLGDREHFVAQQNSVKDELYIGAPVFGRVSNAWTLQFTRKLFDDAGRFAGVVVVSEPLDFFTKSFANHANLGTDGAVLAFRQDGRLLVRASSDGTPLPTGEALERYVASDESSNFIFDPVDHHRRLYARQPVPGYPITAIVALSVRDIYADLERQKNAYWGWAFLLVLALTAAAFLAKSYVRTLLQQRAINANIAETDQLTGLGNRRALDTYTTNRFKRDDRPPVALVLFDIADFAVINDRYGDDVGDSFLKMVANRLTQLTKTADLVVRVKSDQFGVLLSGNEPAARALEFVRALFDSYRFPVHFRGYSQDVTLCVGIGTSEYEDAPGALRGQASYALDLAKRAASQTQRNEYRVYDHAMFQQFGDERGVEEAVHEAVLHGGIEAACTPTLNPRANTVVGIWAAPLLRRSAGDTLAAGTFMDAADRSRLSNSVWTLAIEHATHTVARFGDDTLLWVRVPATFIRDIDPDRYINPNVLSPARYRLAVTGLLDRQLDEISVARITALRGRGVMIYAVVDLDCGSPFALLSSLPVDGMVIEGAWVHASPASSTATPVLNGLIEAAAATGWQTAVTGVTTPEQLAWLSARSVATVSGPYVDATWPVSLHQN